jgi:tyrosyl-tRNA synthetase
LMSISDQLMWRYYLLLTDLTPAEIDVLRRAVSSGSRHPLEVKKSLALRIVSDFHGLAAATQGQKDFEAQFQQHSLPSNIRVTKASFTAPERLDEWLVKLELCKTKSEAQRKIKEGAVYMSVGEENSPQWEKLTDPAFRLNPRAYPTKGGDVVLTFKLGSQPPQRIRFTIQD